MGFMKYTKNEDGIKLEGRDDLQLTGIRLSDGTFIYMDKWNVQYFLEHTLDGVIEEILGATGVLEIHLPIYLGLEVEGRKFDFWVNDKIHIDKVCKKLTTNTNFIIRPHALGRYLTEYRNGAEVEERRTVEAYYTDVTPELLEDTTW